MNVYQAVADYYNSNPTLNRWRLLMAVNELVADDDNANGRKRQR